MIPKNIYERKHMTQFDPLFNVSNKTIIVTGASSGLGVTFAEFLASRGANVVISARRKDKLEELKNKILERNQSVMSISCDVTDSSQVAAMFNDAEERFGRVDGIVNNAGQIAEAGAVFRWETDRGIRVNAIAPGWFPSEMTGAWVRQSAFRHHISNNSPMGRIGKPDELTGTLLLLASEASSFINGQVISVDGGISSSTGLPFFTEEMFQYMEKAVPGGMAKRIKPD